MKSKRFLLIVAGVLLLFLVQGVCAAENFYYERQWGSSGTALGLFTSPYGIAINGSGHVFVSEPGPARVQVFDATGTFLNTWNSSNTYTLFPDGLAIGSMGVVYETEGDDTSEVSVFQADGTHVDRWLVAGKTGQTPVTFSRPRGVAVNSSGYVYVVSYSNNLVQIYASDGTKVGDWGNEGTAAGLFDSPEGIAIDTNDYVYIADTGNNRIQKFTSDGTFNTEWGSIGSGNGQFNSPIGIAIDSDNNVYVSDTGNNRIQKFNRNGYYLGQFGSAGSGNGQFNSPKGIAIDSNYNLYVVDSGNNRIQVISQFTVNPEGDLTYYLGEPIKFTGINSKTATTYLFMTGPDLPAGGVQLNLDPGNSSVTEGNGGTFSQAPVSANRWEYIWSTTEDMPINATAERFEIPHSVFTVYAESQPHDASNVASGDYASQNINLTLPFITGSVNVSSGELGDAFSIQGTKEGCRSPDCYVSVYIKNDTYGGSLPINGTRPDDLSVESISWDNSTFGQATVEAWHGYEYVWDTSAISGGSLLPSSQYQVVVSMRPLNWTDEYDLHMRGLPYAGYYTKLGIGIMGPLHPDYAVNVTTGMQPLTVAFTDLSGGFDDTYMDFGDGTEANFTSYRPIVHTYTSADTFTPVIYAINSTSSEGRTNATITVTPSVGSITVTCTPATVDITLDGAALGEQTTPYEILDIPSGWHHVKIDKSLYISQEKSVYVEGGKNATASFVLELTGTPPGYLGVSSNVTGAKIFVDGADTGQTTPANITGYVGYHSVNLTYNGYFDSQRNVMIPSDTYVPVYIRMDPIPPFITDATVLAGIKQALKEEADDDTSLRIAYASPTLEPAKTIHTLWGVQPDLVSPPRQTTAVFIDKDPGMNWEHPAEYVFIDNLGKKTVIPVMSPSDLPTVQVSGSGYDPAGMDLNAIGSGSTPSTGGGLGVLDLTAACTGPTCTNNYAVLIDGGYDQYNNHIRYWNDISFMYQVLNKTYSYPKDHIRVLMSDGTSTGIDRHNWTYADGRNLTDDSPRYFDSAKTETQVTGGANIDDLIAAFASIPPGADLLVFTTGHGAWDPGHNGGEAMLYLWDQHYIYASDFVDLLPANANSIRIVMEQCNSGGFVDKFIPEGYSGTQIRTIATAAAWDQPSKDNGFSSTWTMAAARIDSNMRPALLADSLPGDSNGKIDFWEASTYAQNNDPYRSVETPQYRESSLLIGKEQFLHTCNNVLQHLRITSPMSGDTWSIGHPNNITWGQTGLDSTTVTISLWNRSPAVLVTNLGTGIPASQGYFPWIPSNATIKAANDYYINITSASPRRVDVNSLKLLAFAKAGKFNVTSVPVQGAYVYVDGLNRSQRTNTLAILGIPPGNHILGVTLAGYKDVELKEYVYSNKYTNETFTLLPPTDNFAGTLVVNSDPTAEIVVDSVPTGLWTNSKVPYNEGSHTVTVRVLGYKTPEERPIFVSSRRPVVEDFTLEAEDWLETEVYDSSSGFSAPIETGVVNAAKAGQIIPVKWHLSNSLGDVSDPLSFVNLRSYEVNCNDYSQMLSSWVNETAPGNSGLQYLGEGNWQYNWKTPKSYAGTCRDMYLEFLHGQTSPVASFEFK